MNNKTNKSSGVVKGVESLEVHVGNSKVFTVYTHGDEHRCLNVNRISLKRPEEVFYADPKSQHGDYYSEIHLEERRDVEVEGNTLIV